ncbi:MAG TPA: hypothetical protein VE709_05390 [Pseudonocardiaceae bacterium]|nr:hypothetical protein [Pseudonocardiaceae bacterium]
MTAPIATLDMDIRSPETRPRGTDRLDLYAVGEADLTRYAALIVPAMADQEHLARHRDAIRDYLDAGGVVVFGGHLHRDWLPGAAPFVPLDPPSLRGYRVAEIADHPVFDGVEADDLTFRRGVAGFFARGHHPVPDGAEVLVRLAGGEPATYVDRVSTRGTILVQASCDLLGYAGSAGGTAQRIPEQLLAWVRAQSRIRQSRTRQSRTRPGAAPRRAPAAAPLTSLQRGGLAAVYGGSAPHHRAITTPKYARHLTGGTVYLPELPDTDLTGLDGLVVPERLHHGLLEAGAKRVLDLLDAGGTVIAFSGGEPLPDFLPGVRWEHRPTNFWWWLEPGASLGLQTPDPNHSLFLHLGLRDCTWHYHGVLSPPDEAEVLVELPTGEALLYVDRASTPGTLIVSTLDPLSHYGSHFMPATERFLDGFLPWASGTLLASAR